MTFGREYGGAADWIVNGGISLAVHAVIIGGVLCFGSGGASSKSEPSAPSPSSVEAKADPIAPAPAPIPEDERVPGVTSGTQSPATSPKAKSPAAKPTQVKPQSGKQTPPKAAADKKATEKPSASAPAKDGAARTETYVVKRGDTLTAIARECGCTPAELAKLNGVSLKVLSDLKFGQKIKIKVPAAD